MTSIVTDSVRTYFKTLISARELQALLSASRVALLDCRFELANPSAGRDAYRAAHIPGARLADLDRDLSGPITPRSGRHPLPDPEKLRTRFVELGIDPSTQTVVYDAANGSFAARAWWLLRWLGARNVALLDRGFAGWIAAGGAVESGDAPALAGTRANRIGASAALAPAITEFAAVADRGAWLSSEEVSAALADPARQLIDARAAERFSGKSEPLDPVAGHVPGAVNFPLAGNLDADGAFLRPDLLRERWQAFMGGRRAANLIMMCGSGVTACHHVLALEHAGLGSAKLYAGSWSEWIKDPGRPTART